MSKLNIIAGALWCAVLSLALVYFVIALIGIASDSSGAQTFYVDDLGATCIESFERGRTSMFCFQGDLRAVK